jgi:hypothetical protein
MDKRSLLAIALIVAIAGGGLYYLHASYEQRLAEAQAMVNSAQAAAKRAQDLMKRQHAADAARRQ